MTPENLIKINFQRGNSKIAPQNRLGCNGSKEKGKLGVQETVLLVNHALAHGTPAIFVIFIVSRASSSKALVLLVRTQIRHFRHFRQKPPFSGGTKVGPVVMQRGFGVTFLFWPSEFEENCRWISQRNLMANFDGEFFGLVFPGFHAHPKKKIHAQNSRPELSAFLSNFTFLNPKFIHGDFLLTWETNKSRGPENGAFGKPCFCPAREKGVLTKMAKMTNLHSNQ